MKKKPWNKWFLASGVLQLGCCVHLLMEWFRYSEVLHSAPFSVTVLVNAMCFCVPAVGCFLIGLYLEKRKRKDDSHENGN